MNLASSYWLNSHRTFWCPQRKVEQESAYWDGIFHILSWWWLCIKKNLEHLKHGIDLKSPIPLSPKSIMHKKKSRTFKTWYRFNSSKPYTPFPQINNQITPSIPLYCIYSKHDSTCVYSTFLWIQKIMGDTNRPISQIPKCICPISHNTPFRAKMCTFMFWMVYFGGYGTVHCDTDCHCFVLKATYSYDKYIIRHAAPIIVQWPKWGQYSTMLYFPGHDWWTKLWSDSTQ